MMRRFVSSKERTPDYLEAVEALRRLAAAGGSPERAFAEAVAEDYEAHYAEANGLKRSSGRPCARRLTGGRCANHEDHGHDYHLAYPSLRDPCTVPGADHSVLWLKDGKPARFTTQPYGLSWETLRELVRYCEDRGLEAHIDARMAWHFPTQTILVEIERADTPAVPETVDRSGDR